MSQIALITGGSRGLGRSIAVDLAKKEINVIATYNTHLDKALAVCDSIKKIGIESACIHLNLANANTFDSFCQDVSQLLKEHFNANKFDFLINNAGHGFLASFGETSAEQLDELYEVHLKGSFLLTQKLLPLMNDNGSIINMSSNLTRIPLPGFAAYASMKGAVEVMSLYLAKELGNRKIRVNVVAPGAVETDFNNGLVRDNEEINKTIAGNTLLGRVGLPDDIGGFVAFLCTEEAKWITGQRIEVSGGQSI